MRRMILNSLCLLLLMPGAALAAGVQATLYKSPTCGCCTEYGRYLERNGFDVEMINRDDMAAVKEKHGVPDHLRSCHTTVIGPYAVEGHIPVEAVDRLLAEKPFTRGIAMPGMPQGSPGMGGSKQGPFEVYYIGGQDSTKLFHRQ